MIQTLRQSILCGDLTPATLVRLPVTALATKEVLEARANGSGGVVRKSPGSQVAEWHRCRPDEGIELSGGKRECQCMKCTCSKTIVYPMPTDSTTGQLSVFVICLMCGDHWMVSAGDDSS